MLTMLWSLSVLVLYMNGGMIWSPSVQSMVFMLMSASNTWDIVDVLANQDANVNIKLKGKSYLGL